MDAFTEQILRSPGYIGHKRQLKPYVRPLPQINHMTSVIDSTVTCTLCRGTRFTITEHHNGLLERERCENCGGTGIMKSRTFDEQWQIDRRPRI